ncbi:MAG: hypothetical protein KJN85_10600 [Maribacter sp.]|nr:hypothetical protein [Maribacter sp.]
MKLTQDQILQIETYLNFKELTHLDLQNEVLDHMATDIEKHIRHGSNFKQAFKNVISDWNHELSEHSSWFIGWVWTGPRILIDKGVKKTKQIYLRTLLATLAVAMTIHLIHNTLIDMEPSKFLNLIVGSAYIVIFFLILLFFWRIKATDYQSTYSFLFKINAIGFAFMYLAFNPILLDRTMIFGKEETYYWALLFHSFLFSFAYSFWDLYKSHFSSKKLVLS